MLTRQAALGSILVVVPLVLILHRVRLARASRLVREQAASDHKKAAWIKKAAAPRQPAVPVPEDSDEEEVEEEEDAREKAIWKRVETVLKEYSLSPLMIAASRKWVRQMSDPNNTELARLRQWMLHRINGRLSIPTPLSDWQRGCPEILGGLRAQPFWGRADGVLEWLRPFEEHFEEIRCELLALRSQRGFQPLKIPNWASKKAVASPDGAGSVSHDVGDWNVYYLILHEVPYLIIAAAVAVSSLLPHPARGSGLSSSSRSSSSSSSRCSSSRLTLTTHPGQVPFPENCARCPVTTRLLKALPRSYQHAFFSALTPGTHIIKHHGPTNKKLRIHLPLVGAPGSELRVADQHVLNKEGECMVLDDPFEHATP